MRALAGLGWAGLGWAAHGITSASVLLQIAPYLNPSLRGVCAKMPLSPLDYYL